MLGFIPAIVGVQLWCFSILNCIDWKKIEPLKREDIPAEDGLEDEGMQQAKTDEEDKLLGKKEGEEGDANDNTNVEAEGGEGQAQK